jgi:hypothetical protein
LPSQTPFTALVVTAAVSDGHRHDRSKTAGRRHIGTFLKYPQAFWFEQDQAQVLAVFLARQQLQFSTKSIPLYSLSCEL